MNKQPPGFVPRGFPLCPDCLRNGGSYFVRTEFKEALAVGVVVKEEQLDQDRLGVGVSHDAQIASVLDAAVAETEI